VKRKHSSQTHAADAAPKAPGPQPHRPLLVYLIAALLLLAAASILATWADQKPVGDLFVALAGGRDVADGKLGGPDDWSFLTTGRIWINQNWLSHFLIYLAWRAAGETGLLVLKAVLLTAMAAFLALLTRRRGCTWPVAILLSAGLTMSCSQFVQLRANLLTLVMIPLLLWLLHRTIESRHRIWWTLPVLLAWANLHGGFVFGIGMVGLWAVCITVADSLGTHRNPLPRDWPLWVCAAGCIAVAAISPFGFENLTHPLVIASSKAWRQVPEWRPLLQSPFPTPWGFFLVLGMTAGLSLIRLLGAMPALFAATLTGRGRKSGATPAPPVSPPAVSGKSAGAMPGAHSRSWATGMLAREENHARISVPTPLGPIVFDAILAVLVVTMAFKSQRFAPLVVLVLAAPLASCLAWLVRRLGRYGIPALASCVLVAFLLLARQDLRAYRPDNPVRVGTTVFDRMHLLSEQYPVRAAEFVAGNHLAGNTVCEWEWEGYVHWTCPGLKLLIGGRAQQIYTEDHLAAFGRIYDPKVGPAWLQQHQVRLAVLLNGGLGRILMSGLLATGRWASIYSDGQSMVLVDRQLSPDVVQQALDGRLIYPSEAVRALSRAVCLATAGPSAGPAEILAAATQANAASPAPQAYSMIVRTVTRAPSLRGGVLLYLEQESSRLSQLPATSPDRLTILLCRREIQVGLAALYREMGQPAAASAAKAEADSLDRQIDAIQIAWN
jgi:hypothetical protein